MWNEAECGLRLGMWNVVRCGMRQSVLWHEMWNVVRCGMRQSVGCDTARYVLVEVVLCEMW